MNCESCKKEFTSNYKTKRFCSAKCRQRAAATRYIRKYPEKNRENVKRWQKNNPEKYREKHRKYAKKWQTKRLEYFRKLKAENEALNQKVKELE